MPSPADNPGRPRRLVRAVAWSGGALLALALAVYAGFPWLASALAPRLAPAFGVEVRELEVGRPGLTTLAIARLHLVSGRLQSRAEDMTVVFRPLEALRGRLESVNVARLALRLADVPAGAAGPAGTPAGLPAPDTWLAVLPAREVSVTTLELAVPALEFRAGGGLELSGPALLAHLTGRSPAAAEGMTLAASLTRDGRVGASLTAPGADSAFVALSSAVEAAGGAERLGVRGSVDLRGFALALVRTLAGVPPGDGRLTGSFALTLPWPLPATPDWTSPAGAGDIEVDWRPAAGDWRLDGLAASWQVADGLLGAGLNGTVALAGQSFVMQGRLGDWRLPAAAGSGSLTLSLPPSVAAETNDRPVLQAAWNAQSGTLAVDGFVDIAEGLFDRVAALTAAPRGAGRVRVEYAARLPWPLEPGPPTLAGSGIRADGTISGRWQPAGPGPGLPRLDGRWRLEGAALTGSVETEVGYRGLRAGLSVTLDRLALDRSPPAAAGSVGLGDAGSLAFDLAPAGAAGTLRATLDGAVDAGAGDGLLAGIVDAWPGEFELTAGRIELDAELGWPDDAIVGNVQVGLGDVSAYYQSYRLSGLHSVLRFEGSAAGWQLPVTSLRAASLDTGVELRDLDSGVGWRGEVVEVQATTAALLGGRVSIEPFDYRLDTGTAEFLVTFDDLELAQVLAVQGEQVQGTGSLDGGLPIRIEDGRPSISGGRVHADAPGGQLRVSQSLASPTGQPGLDFALRALQNFDYSVLAADVDYAADGDLTLAVHLEGRNPAVEEGRPIHYNVTVNQNLPVLLESLRLQDNVTRSIERRLNTN